MTICNKVFYGTRSQVLMMLYFALSRKPGRTRQDTVDYIAGESWFAHESEDFKKYPFAGTNEDRWRILIAFGRMDAAKHKPEPHVFSNWNSWELNRDGVEEFDRCLSYFRLGNGDVAKGYLWTPVFKKLLDPKYAETAADKKRPLTIYQGFEASIQRARKKMILDSL
ncbi:MAG: hypothetical protein WC003_03835 [Terrimicrobiaceae bacterium]